MIKFAKPRAKAVSLKQIKTVDKLLDSAAKSIAKARKLQIQIKRKNWGEWTAAAI